MKVPVQVLVHQKTRTLELIYQNNARAVFPFEFLRVFSPSAEVQGHSPDEAVLQVGKAEVGLKGVEPVGQYALRLLYDDVTIQASTVGTISRSLIVSVMCFGRNTLKN